MTFRNSEFSFSSQCTRLNDRNSPSCLEAQDEKKDILVIVSKHQTERKKFSFPPRKLKKASRQCLADGRANKQMQREMPLYYLSYKIRHPKKSGVFWEFFPQMSDPSPPFLGTPCSKKQKMGDFLKRLWCFLGDFRVL